MSFFEMLYSVILFQCANVAHLSNRFCLYICINGWPVSFESCLIDLEFALLAASRFMVCESGVVEEGRGVLSRNGLRGGLFDEILFFHLFYNFYRNGRTMLKTLSISH